MLYMVTLQAVNFGDYSCPLSASRKLIQYVIFVSICTCRSLYQNRAWDSVVCKPQHGLILQIFFHFQPAVGICPLCLVRIIKDAFLQRSRSWSPLKNGTKKTLVRLRYVEAYKVCRMSMKILTIWLSSVFVRNQSFACLLVAEQSDSLRCWTGSVRFLFRTDKFWRENLWVYFIQS